VQLPAKKKKLSSAVHIQESVVAQKQLMKHCFYIQLVN
jgi:hypothetical protein